MNILIKILIIFPTLLAILNDQYAGINAQQSKKTFNFIWQEREKRAIGDGFKNLSTGTYKRAMQGESTEKTEPSKNDDIKNFPSGGFKANENVVPEKQNGFKNLSSGVYEETMFEQYENRLKMFYYDKFGKLHIDGSVSGVSKPIVLDYKKYWSRCGTNVNYYLTFTVPDYRTVEAINKVASISNLTRQDRVEMLSSCPFGLTFCYEGQLGGPAVRQQYSVSNVISDEFGLPAQKVAFQCMLALDSPDAHGFNVAVVAFTGLEELKIGGQNKHVRSFDILRFVIFTMSIVKEEYYFLVPKNGKVILEFGDPHSFKSRLVNTEKTEMQSASFKINGKTYGQEKLSDTMPKLHQIFKYNRGFWMLYLDFKSAPKEMQIVQTIHTEDCQMKVDVNGNRMRKCRSYFEDIAVTEPSNVEMDLIYTSEVGTIQRSDHGQEDVQELLKKKEKENLQKTITKTSERTIINNGTTNETMEGKAILNETHSTIGLGAGLGMGAGLFVRKSPIDGEAFKRGPGGKDASLANNDIGRGLTQKQLFNDNIKGMKNFLGLDELNGPLTPEMQEEEKKIREGLDVLYDVGKNTYDRSDHQDEANELGALYLKATVFRDIYQANRPKRNALIEQEPKNDGSKSTQQQILEAAQELLEFKAGQISLGLGSLIRQNIHKYANIFGSMGKTITKIAADGGAEKIEELAANLQNLLAPSMGGLLISASELMRNLIANDIAGGNSNPPKLPNGRIRLPDGQVLTNETFEHWPEGVKIPNGLSLALKSMGVDVDSSRWWKERSRTTGGDITIKNKALNNDDVEFVIKRRQKRELKIPNIGGGGGKPGAGGDKGGQKQGGLTPGQAAFVTDTTGEVAHRVGFGAVHESWKQNINGSLNKKFDSGGRRTFSDVNSATSLMQSFKQTSGISEKLTSADFAQYSQSFTKRESVDIQVSNLPKNKKIIISQLIFECDGNILKLPKLFFHDGVELIKGLKQNTLGGGVQSMVTTEDRQGKKKKPKDNAGKKINKRSTLSELNDEHNEAEKWENLTLAERVVIDPSFLFEEDD